MADVSSTVFSSERPDATLAVLLHLSWLRSVAIVAVSLAATYPSAAEWEAALNDPIFVEEVGAFASLVADIRARKAAGDLVDFAALQREAEQHYERALECVALTARRLDLAPEDLLAALVHA